MQRNSIICPRKEEQLSYGYIYITTNLINYKQYIGQHCLNSNHNYLGSGKILKRAIEKYGKENFISEPIDWAESKEELDQKEIWWIDFLGAVEGEGWYNVDCGGTGYSSGELHPGYGKIGPTAGIPMKPESKSKMIQSLTGRKLTKEHKKHIGDSIRGKLKGENNPMYGYKFSEEQKQQWSKERSGENNPFYGKHHSKETKAKIRASLPNQNGENNPNYGHKWSEEKKSKVNTAKPVVQLSLSGEFIAEFPYMRATGYNGDYISQCCRGLKSSYKGFIWMFKSDYEKQHK